MNHLVRLNSLFLLRNRILPCRCSFFHFTKTLRDPLSNDSLKRRIVQAPDSTLSVVPLLREWSQLGKKTSLSDLRRIITTLHGANRFSHALQVSQWMSDENSYNLTQTDFETRLLLIAKVDGLQQAHDFLDIVPMNKRGFFVHNALLNRCKAEGSLSIAECTFKKMEELDLLAQNQPEPFNTMLYLYVQAQNHEMVVLFLRKMDSYGMEPQGLDFAQLLGSYSVTSSGYDIDGMEKFLSKWEKKVEMPWALCYFPGLVYCASGFMDKGLPLLRSTEPLLAKEKGNRIFNCLMTIYCQEGLTEDVYRLWNLCKGFMSFESFGCSDIIKTLTMKGDLDVAHEVLEEWDSGGGDLDLADFGLRKRFVKEEADKVVNMLGKKESKWDSLTQKLEKSLLEDEDDREEERRKRVAEAMEGRLSDHWNPKGSLALSAYTCVQYVEGQRDLESAADILRQLRKRDQVSHAMDKNRLGLKMVEAMVGGGYVGGEDLHLKYNYYL